MSDAPPSELDGVRDAVGGALGALPACDLLLVLASAASPGEQGLHTGGLADLGGLSRPDLAAGVGGMPQVVERAAAATGLPVRGGPLPLDAAVLALLAWPVAEALGASATLPVVLAPGPGEQLRELGRRLGGALEQEPFAPRVAVVAAGDLAAGHTEKAPRHLLEGSAAWDERLAGAVERGDWTAVAGLGPDEARRLSARGWPALAALGGLLGDGHGLRVAFAGAPRGVGYLVAST